MIDSHEVPKSATLTSAVITALNVLMVCAECDQPVHKDRPGRAGAVPGERTCGQRHYVARAAQLLQRCTITSYLLICTSSVVLSPIQMGRACVAEAFSRISACDAARLMNP